MGVQYTVRPGDTLDGIAKRNRYASWRVIYNHPENEAFRKLRPNPGLIRPGDKLVLPKAPQGRLPLASLKLPDSLAGRLKLPSPRLRLDPILAPQLAPQLGQLFLPPLHPSGQPTTAPITLCGPMQTQFPTGLMGEPIRGGYGTALKWTARAALKCKPIADQIQGVKQWGIDIAWHSAAPWQKTVEIGVGLAGTFALLWFRPSREFLREQAHGTRFDLGLLGLDGFSVEPRLGINADFGASVRYEMQF